MNIKKLLILGLILIAASTALGTISAADGISSTSTSMTLVNNNLTINGIQFTVPDGFEEVEKDTDKTGTDNDGEMDTADIDGTTVDSKIESEFKNSANEKVEVTVGILSNDKKIESINPAGFEKKSIAGKDGFIKNDTEDGKAQVDFEYLQDGKLVKIEAPNEDMISKIIA